MDISVIGRNLDVGEALRGHVHDNLSGAVTKYFLRALDAHVVFSRQGHRLRADISVHPGPRGMVVQGASESEDAYAAFDGALERIAKQLRRYKRRLNDHHKGHAQDVLPALQYVIQPDHHENELPEEGQPTVIAEMSAEIPTLTVSQAVMRMDLADQPVQMFRDRASGRINVVYRRNDGNIGWIDPSDKAKKKRDDGKTKTEGKK
ncbi:MAG TPA: ribosome-associated translation inhibitor RaiA [Rhodospirillales bacterium]|jgi:ribosomal subunit interface protein